jgi:hypothetical protein
MLLAFSSLRSIIVEYLDMRKLSAKWVPNAWTRIKNVNGASRLGNNWNLFGAIQMVFSRDWWPWTKLGYTTTIRRQSNKQWFGSIAAQPAPKNSERKNPPEKFSPRFLGIKTASFSLIIFHRAKLSTRSITYLCWCNWRTFWRKNAAGTSPRGSCSCTEETDLPGLPVSWSPTLFSGSDPIGLPFVPWTEKTIECSPFFVRRGSHCCRGDLVGRTKFWIFFFGCLQKLEQRTKKCVELRGVYVE